MRLDIDILHRQGDFVLDAKLLIEESATGVFGHSGSGKSTLLRCIAGLIKPSIGRIELDGETLFDSDRRIWVPPHKRRIGVVFQEPRLFPHWTVRKNLIAGKSRRNIKPPCSEAQVVDLLRIEPLLDRSVRELSGGEKQRVSLARTLLAYPRLMLMDEPLSALDSFLKSRILPFLDRIHRELDIPTLMVSHELTELLHLSDQLVLMKGGNIVSHGTLSDVVKHDEMAELIQEKDLNHIIGHQLRGRVINDPNHHECSLSN
ncbi:molybdenum ABC transporter ATP-binding protein [Pontiella sulfatireligans]|uniref:Sulfate/thiosulfate import ATP-binding protein CysA n=1 Tax=Pontiella sulfatireligans TaxID=2750658 RepID=A0A6C2UQ50_9BACT|nr:molybdenum ABC transporter ATP-binding protein [Pontiella sulfatireligans]VGO22422.1 Sulfate/thiosulfate import ATP-binding protein CysA [Pontiella sulfatireligans]